MELELVQRVELKLLLADTDAKLSTALVTFLAPLLQKLASPSIEVVQKVVDVLKFVKMRKNESREVRLPLDRLNDLYEKCVFDFSPGTVRQNRQILSFIGLELTNESEIDLTRDRNLLNKFVYGLRNDSNTNADVKHNTAEQFSLFLLLLTRLLKEDTEIVVDSWDEQDLHVVQNRLAQLFLLNVRKPPAAQPLLSPEDVAFFLDHNAKNGIKFMPDNDAGINASRKAVIKLAHSFPEQFKYLLAAAMGDPMLDISRQARSDVMKLKEFDSKTLQSWAIHGNDSLSMECIDLLIREHSFDDIDPQVILAPFSRGDLRLRQAALRLLREIAVSSSRNWSPEVNLRISKVLRQYIIDDGWPRSQLHSSTQSRLRQLCYELLGAFDPGKSTLWFLFQSLERDSADVAQSIQKSLSWVLEVGGADVDAEKLFQFMNNSSSSRTRYAAVKFARARLEPTAPLHRVICLLGLDPSKNRSDVVLESQGGLLAESDRDLPEFNAMIRDVDTFMDLRTSSKEVINTTLLFLFACLIRFAPASADWMSDLTAAVSLSASPLETTLKAHISESLPLIRLLLSFIRSDVYYENVPLLLRCILLVLPESSVAELQSSGVVSANDFVAALQKESNGYGQFVAEYLPQIAPQIKIDTSTTSLEVLAQAFRAAALKSPSEKLSEHAVQTKNLDAIQVLAVADQLRVTESVEDVVSKTQMPLACLAVHAGPEKRKEIFSSLLKKVSNSFDDIVANGEAISVAASGWNSKVLRERYPYLVKLYANEGDGDVDMSDSPSTVPGHRSWELEELALKDIVTGIRGSPESRRIAAVRLLCLTQYSFYDIGKSPGVASGIQSCFMSLLSDHDEVTQESAGRGLGILFENSDGDSTLQNSLLSMLLSSFTNDTAAKQHTAGTLTAETQVFEPGTLPSEPRGNGSISTYKDVMSLANETGDSSLVYKFMSLSASSQIWAGRKGIAFSLEQILAKSELASQVSTRSELGEKLIPKLFRYLYDPVEVTKQAMKHIWSALVPSSRRSHIVKLYLPEIKKILTEGIIEREWRVREASTRAMSDLVSQGYLEDTVDLWRAGFRAVDDIKESVNAAGSELLKTLTSSLVRSNSMGKPTDLKEIVPFLVKGLSNESTVAFSVDTLLKLSETKGFKPWAAGILEELTLQLSSLEPQALNYLALKTNQQMVDEARVKGLRNSPIMQGIEAMVERGAPSTEEMWNILPRIVKKGVGVSSKLAGAKLIILTCMHTYGSEKHASEQLLSAAFAELWSSNEVINQNYAGAIGYLGRQLPTSLVVAYIDQLKVKFLNSESDDDRTRNTVGLALKSLSTNCNDAFSSVSSSALPLAFVGKFIPSEANSFKEVWESNTGGSLSLKLYHDEIIQYCLEILQTSSVRILKVAASKAISETFSQSQTGLPRMSVNIELAVKSLLSSLSGRSWPDKEFLFEALVALYPVVASDPKTVDLRKQTEERILNEIQRKNTEYKLGIIPSVARFLRFFRDDEVNEKSESVGQIEQQLVNGFIDIAENDSDDVVEAFKATIPALESPDFLYNVVDHAMSQKSWKFRVAACDAIQTEPFNERIWHLLTKNCANDEHYEKVRLEWCHAAAKFKEQNIVLDDVRSRLQREKSTLLINELKAIL